MCRLSKRAAAKRQLRFLFQHFLNLIRRIIKLFDFGKLNCTLIDQGRNFALNLKLCKYGDVQLLGDLIQLALAENGNLLSAVGALEGR